MQPLTVTTVCFKNCNSLFLGLGCARPAMPNCWVWASDSIWTRRHSRSHLTSQGLGPSVASTSLGGWGRLGGRGLWSHLLTNPLIPSIEDGYHFLPQIHSFWHLTAQLPFLVAERCLPPCPHAKEDTGLHICSGAGHMHDRPRTAASGYVWRVRCPARRCHQRGCSQKLTKSNCLVFPWTSATAFCRC